MTEPRKELLKISDILEWFPGLTRYQVELAISSGGLHVTKLPGAKQRRFHKEAVRQAFSNQPSNSIK